MSWGKPRTRSATMFRCTSLVPPPMVKAGENKKPPCQFCQPSTTAWVTGNWGLPPNGPWSVSMPWVPVRSFANCITFWPCSSARALRTEASGPGCRPWSCAVNVRRRISRKTSPSMCNCAVLSRSVGSEIPPASRMRSMRSLALGPLPHKAPSPDNDTRSFPKVTFASHQPSFSSPIRLSTGSSMSSKKV